MRQCVPKNRFPNYLGISIYIQRGFIYDQQFVSNKVNKALTSDKLLGPCLSTMFLCSWVRLEESLLRTLLPTEYSTGLELCDVPILYRSSCKFPVVFDFSKLPLLENTPIQIYIRLNKLLIHANISACMNVSLLYFTYMRNWFTRKTISLSALILDSQCFSCTKYPNQILSTEI